MAISSVQDTASDRKHPAWPGYSCPDLFFCKVFCENEVKSDFPAKSFYLISYKNTASLYDSLMRTDQQQRQPVLLPGLAEKQAKGLPEGDRYEGCFQPLHNLGQRILPPLIHFNDQQSLVNLPASIYRIGKYERTELVEEVISVCSVKCSAPSPIGMAMPCVKKTGKELRSGPA